MFSDFKKKLSKTFSKKNLSKVAKGAAVLGTVAVGTAVANNELKKMKNKNECALPLNDNDPKNRFKSTLSYGILQEISGDCNEKIKGARDSASAFETCKMSKLGKNSKTKPNIYRYGNPVTEPVILYLLSKFFPLPDELSYSKSKPDNLLTFETDPENGNDIKTNMAIKYKNKVYYFYMDTNVLMIYCNKIDPKIGEAEPIISIQFIPTNENKYTFKIIQIDSRKQYLKELVDKYMPQNGGKILKKNNNLNKKKLKKYSKKHSKKYSKKGGNKVLNPSTGRYVKRNGRIGKNILNHN